MNITPELTGVFNTRVIMIVKCSGFTKIADRYRELFTVGKCYLVNQKSEKVFDDNGKPQPFDFEKLAVDGTPGIYVHFQNIARN